MTNTLFHQQILTPLLSHFAQHAANDAFLIAGKTYSYLTLHQRVSAIRNRLHPHTGRPAPLAIILDDHIDTYASILALWFEGLAYIPLHPLQPASRNLNILQQTNTHTLLCTSTSSDLATQAKQRGIETIQTTSLPPADKPTTTIAPANDTDLAYILFTSGSTGTPKGVCITRGNLAAFINSFWQTGITIQPNDRCLQAFDLTFDVSIQTFLTALLSGACVCTIPYGQIKYLYAAQLIMEQHISCASMAPSMLTYLKPYFAQLDAKSLKTCILTAEACPIDLLEQWSQCATNANLYDFYGPTEATIYCTYYQHLRNHPNPSANGICSIGKPLANVQAIIIDENLQPLPQGQKGELCVAGPQITPGYWNNPEKNSTAFLTLTANNTATTYYRTGDLCLQNPDGNLLYFGRIDQQAKIQGYRVELGEIEFQAHQHLAGQHRTAAIAYTDSLHITQIALFIEASDTDTDALTAHLKNTLPPYMIPSRIICLEYFPLNRSEKIDRNALKQMLTAPNPDA